MLLKPQNLLLNCQYFFLTQSTDNFSETAASADRWPTGVAARGTPAHDATKGLGDCRVLQTYSGIAPRGYNAVAAWGKGYWQTTLLHPDRYEAASTPGAASMDNR